MVCEAKTVAVQRGVALQEELLVVKAKLTEMEGRLHALDARVVSNTKMVEMVKDDVVTLREKVTDHEVELHHVLKDEEVGAFKGKASSLVPSNCKPHRY
ncbi:hypothetical protein ACLOJK_006565 [Asimina triloba]